MAMDTMEKGTVIRTGTLTAVCYGTELINGVGKEVHDEAAITKWGIPGDKHYGETRYSSSLKATVPNNRTVTVVGRDAARDACAKLGVPEVPPGGLGENLYVEGAGDLSDMLPDDEIHVTPAGSSEPNVILKVGGQNDPCSNLSFYHKQIVKELYGKRGLLCTVLKEGRVSVGDIIQVVRSGT